MYINIYSVSGVAIKKKNLNSVLMVSSYGTHTLNRNVCSVNQNKSCALTMAN